MYTEGPKMILEDLPYPEEATKFPGNLHMVDRLSYIDGYNQAMMNARAILKFVSGVPESNLPLPSTNAVCAPSDLDKDISKPIKINTVTDNDDANA